METLRRLPPPSLGSDLTSPEGPEKLWWDRSIFSSSEDMGEGSCPPVIDVTGRARTLVYGPNLVLAPGVWRATTFVHLSPDAARRRMTVQFGTETDHAIVGLPLGVPGDHEVELTLIMHDAEQVQIQLCLKKAAFHGEVRFAGASVERITNPPPTTLDRASVEDV
jgi:hypothetical protein